MGNWRITIEGMGIHHNGQKAIMKDGTTIYGGVPSEKITDILRWEPSQPTDANLMFHDWVEQLKAVGHKIYQAKFEVFAGQIDYDS